MTIETLRDICNDLLNRGFGDYVVYTKFKNSDGTSIIDRDEKTITFV